MPTKNRRKAFDIETSREIGQRIRRARGEHSQAEFAALIGVSRSALTNYESGRRLPNDEVLKKISSISGSPIPSILFGQTAIDFNKYWRNVERGAMEASAERPGFFPRFLISDDEYSLVVLLRVAAWNDEALPLLKSLFECTAQIIDEDKRIGRLPVAWGEGHIERLKAAVRRGGLEEGYDPDMQFWATFPEATFEDEK